MEGADPGNPTPREHSSRRSPRTVGLNSRGRVCFPPSAWSPGSQRPPLADLCRPNCAHWWPGRAPQRAGVRKGRGWRRPAQLSGSWQGHRHSAATLASEGPAGRGGGCSLPGRRGRGSWPRLCPFLLPAGSGQGGARWVQWGCSDGGAWGPNARLTLRLQGAPLASPHWPTPGV